MTSRTPWLPLNALRRCLVLTGLSTWSVLSAVAQVPPTPSSVAAPTQGKDVLTQAASSVGVRRCLPAMTRLSRLNVQGSQSHDVLLDWDRERPDDGPVFGFIGAQYPNAGVATSITVVPDAAGACTVSAERTAVAPFTCESVAKSELQGYQMTRLLPIYAVYIDPKEPNSSVSLLDSPPGCLVIRRFVEYHWRDPSQRQAAPKELASAPNARRPKAP